jgi:hypothetical protein
MSPIKLIPIYSIAKLSTINLALSLSLFQFVKPMLCVKIRRVTEIMFLASSEEQR